MTEPEVNGEQVVDRAFNPGRPIMLRQKDFNVVHTSTANALQLMQASADNGLTEMDHRAPDKMAAHLVEKDEGEQRSDFAMKTPARRHLFLHKWRSRLQRWQTMGMQ